MIVLFDIGATHMRIAVRTEEGIGEPVVLHTPQDPQAAIALFVATAHSLSEHVEQAVGGVAGNVGEDGVIVSATNLPNWNGFTFGPHLTEALGAPVVVHNDAELNGLGEARYGAGVGYANVAYLGVGTGVGTSHVVDGVIDPGSGENMRTHIIALADGSSLEERIGGHSLERRHGVPPPELPPEVWTELTPYLAEGVVNEVRTWNPDVVVLGGSLITNGNGFDIDTVITEARTIDATLPPILISRLGGVSGLWGARALT